MVLCSFANTDHLVTGEAYRTHTPVRLTLHTAWPGPAHGPLYPGGRPGAGGTYAHFFIDSTGELFQHRDTDLAARADGAGNYGAISVETWDGYRQDGLNAAQLETLARLWAWARTAHPTIPNRVASVGDLRGMAWHRLGCDGNYGAYRSDDPTTWCRRQTGAHWSSVQGKTCPTDAKIRQAVAIVAGNVSGQGAQAVTQAVQRSGRVIWYDRQIDGIWGPYSTRALQRALAAENRYDREIDGDFGPYTVKAWQSWLRDQGTYPADCLIDGDFGYWTVCAVQLSMRARGLYGTDYLIDGNFGPYTITAVQNWLARKY